MDCCADKGKAGMATDDPGLMCAHATVRFDARRLQARRLLPPRKALLPRSCLIGLHCQSCFALIKLLM
eukprot:14987751-Heterocapsa_arctica.AAC.1